MVPELFTDGFGQIVFREGMLRIELVSLSSGVPEVRHNLIMTLPAFLRAMQVQKDILRKFEEAGLLRAVAADGTAAPLPGAESTHLRNG
jgi:hypothetical protein